MKYLSVFFVLSMLLLNACADGKAELLERYHEIYSIIDSSDPDALLAVLDKPSIQYMNFIADGNNLHYDEAIEYGSIVELDLMTASYANYMGDIVRTREGELDYATFFGYLKFTNVPLFRIENPAVLDESRVELDNGLGFVTVKNKLLENAVISSRVHFTREGEEYKLDLLSLLRFEERLLRQQYQAFRQASPSTGLADAYPDDVRMQTDVRYRFIQEQHSPEHQLRGVQVRVPG